MENFLTFIFTETMWLLGDIPHLLNNVSISQNNLRQDELQLGFFNLNSKTYLHFKRLTML